MGRRRRSRGRSTGWGSTLGGIALGLALAAVLIVGAIVALHWVFHRLLPSVDSRTLWWASALLIFGAAIGERARGGRRRR